MAEKPGDTREDSDSPEDVLSNPSRLATLAATRLLDSPVEAAFDRLTRLAATATSAPMALVSLVDDHRQFFKSAVGLPEPWASRRETPLSHSFCRHAVATGRPLVISDARADPEFRDNLAIPALNVAAYAGIPLMTSRGETLGTLCVLDTRAREWTEPELNLLSDLAALVMNEIELRGEVAGKHGADAGIKRLNLLLNSTAEGIYSLDTNGYCTFANRACARLLGYSDPADLLGKRMHDLIHHTRSDGSVYPIGECKVYRAFRAGRRAHVADEVLWRADGTSFPSEYWSYPIVEDGKVLGAVVTFVDISKRRAAERLLRESEIRYRETFENAAVGMAHVSLDGKWLRINDRLCQLLDYQREELLDRTVQDLTDADDRVRESDYLQSVLAGGRKNYSMEKRFLCRDGRKLWVHETVSLIYDVAGQPLHLISIIQDISEQKEVEKALWEAKHAAEAANRAKSDFLANMSHEIRTPMTAILGFADVLSSRLRDPEDILCLDTIKRNGRYLLDIIDDILDLSKIEAGKLKVEISTMSLPGLLSDLKSLISMRAEEKSVGFSLEYAGPVPQTIRTDPTRLRQILINLIGNAIKFTESGTVRLVVAYDEACAPPALTLRIIDTGIGITPEQLKTIFQPFTQADSSVTRRYGGTGLGLPITKTLIDSLGGHIDVDSEAGRGTTVTVTLPSPPADDAPLVIPGTAEVTTAVEPSTTLHRPARILVVEDQRDTRALLTRYLTEAGAEVFTAVNGRVAIDLVARHTYDAVIMDMQMPVLDGYQAARILREGGFDRPLIALTAAAMRGDRAKCLDAGCNEYLTKPLDPAKLIALLNELLPRGSAAAQPAARAADAEPAGTPRRILIVDDNEDACQATSELLKIIGYEVRAAHAGEPAVDIAVTYRPHAALVDIGLPDIDGYELARRLKAQSGLEGLVLIALSGFAPNADNPADAGFSEYLVKPVDVVTLKAALEANGVTPSMRGATDPERNGSSLGQAL